MQLFPVVFVDRGKARDRERRASWIRCRDAERANTFTAKFQQLDQENDRLVDLLDSYMTNKRKRDFEIRLLKESLEKRKTYPRGVPPGPSPEQLQEQRVRDAEKARKDAEYRLNFIEVRARRRKQPVHGVYEGGKGESCNRPRLLS